MAPEAFYGLQKKDSGGPLVDREKARPRVVGVASAASCTGLAIYEDVEAHRGWIVDEACRYYREKWGEYWHQKCRRRMDH
jgi:hypothetical protein